MKNNETIAVTEKPQMVERAFLVGLQHPEMSDETVEELLDELADLSKTLGVPVVGRMAARLREPQSRYLVGSGRAQEIVEQARAVEADVIIFDDQLSPSQQRNWEQLSKVCVVDRHEVILDIFGQRAQTREAVLQVELARAKYDLPRLKRRWGHLSRQRGASGGAGTRDAGEQQIEIDSRLVRRRIDHLQSQLRQVRRQRDVQRKQRLKKPVPVAAIVGYTNAGKSSLLNAVTQADVFTEDKLFATLDPTVRRLVLPNRQELLLSDTVGFVRKLPHQLVEAFKSTLEEAVNADFLVEVLDVSSAEIEQHHRTTREVLAELGAGDKPVITVFNKIDLIHDEHTVPRFRRRHPDAVFVSARDGVGLDQLEARLAEELERSLRQVELMIPHHRYDLIALLHRTSSISLEKYTDQGARIVAAVPLSVLASVKKFAKESGKGFDIGKSSE